MKTAVRDVTGKGGAVGQGIRTNIVLDSRLVTRVKRLARVATTRDAVHVALEHYARSRDYSGLLDLYGSGGVAKGYDPKSAAPAKG